MLIRNRLTISLALASALCLIAIGATAASAQNTEKPNTPAETPKAAPVKGVLDGKFFKGEVGREGQTTGKPCSIMFRNGMLHAHGEKGEGLSAAAAYTATEANGVWTFTATTSGDKKGQAEWQGTVKGAELEATVTTTEPGQPPAKMWVKATKAAMPERSKSGTHEPKGTEPPAAPPKTK